MPHISVYASDKQTNKRKLCLMDTVRWECATVALRCGVAAVDSRQQNAVTKGCLTLHAKCTGPWPLSCCFTCLCATSSVEPRQTNKCNSQWRTFNVTHLLLRTCSHQHFWTCPPLSPIHTLFFNSFSLPSVLPFQLIPFLIFSSFPSISLASSFFLPQSLHYFDLPLSYF